MRSFLSSFRPQPVSQPDVSVVVVSYNMRREIPRTLQSLSVPYQRNIERAAYEIILVDNGSEQPWREQDFADLNACVRIVNLRNATSSPVPAINRGLAEARGRVVGVLIDGARMVTPGLLDACRRAARLYDRPVIATLGFHLGFEHQSVSVSKGYNQEVEDRLLQSIQWPQDGYRLFEISVLNASCAWGWFRPITESNALFLPAALWKELGGYDEAFQLPGGGLANLDVYKRALHLAGAELVMLLGEGNFHQVHGGVASNASENRWAFWHDDYKRIRGCDYEPPTPRPVYFGSVESPALGHLDGSVRAAMQRGRDAAPAYIELLKKILLQETNLETGSAEERIGGARAENIQFCVESALRLGIPGDLVECGVPKDAGSILMRGILKAYGVTDRSVWVAECFRGASSTALDRTKCGFERFGLLDDQTRLLPSGIEDALPDKQIARISLLRLNGASTVDALRNLYDRVSPGGFLIIDGYGAAPERGAIDEFRRERGLRATLERIDATAVFWRKEI